MSPISHELWPCEIKLDILYRSVLGKGVNATVYSQGDDEATKDVYRKELVILQASQSPFVIPLVGTLPSTQPKKTRIVMKRLECPFDVTTASDVHIKQFISAVKFMHTQGIAHADLKVSNLCLNRQNEVNVFDFGEANWFDIGITDTKMPIDETEVLDRMQNLDIEPPIPMEMFIEIGNKNKIGVDQLGCFEGELVWHILYPEDDCVAETKLLNLELLLCDIIGATHVIADMQSKRVIFNGAGFIAAEAGKQPLNSRLKRMADSVKEKYYEEAKQRIEGVVDDTKLLEFYLEAIRRILYSTLTRQAYSILYSKWMMWMENFVLEIK